MQNQQPDPDREVTITVKIPIKTLDDLQNEEADENDMRKQQAMGTVAQAATSQHPPILVQSASQKSYPISITLAGRRICNNPWRRKFLVTEQTTLYDLAVAIETVVGLPVRMQTLSIRDFVACVDNECYPGSMVDHAVKTMQELSIGEGCSIILVGPGDSRPGSVDPRAVYPQVASAAGSLGGNVGSVPEGDDDSETVADEE